MGAYSYEPCPPFWQGIFGFFDYEDVYDDFAKRALDGDCIVEVGCLLGRSACYLGTKIKQSRKRISVLCVDVWPSTYKINCGGPRDVEAPFETFLANIRQADLLDVIIPIRSPSLVAASLVRNDLACVFIDGDHSYEGCRDDIVAWLPKVRRGGILAGHDYSDTFPGVIKATNELFGERLRFVSKQCWYVDIV